MQKSILSTVLLSPEYIPDKQVQFIKKLSGNNDNIQRLMGLCGGIFFVNNHPFNFSYWSMILEGLQMNKRDIIWSEYLRSLDDFIKDLFNEFNFLQSYPTLSDEQIQKMCLVADFLMWSFTSTNNGLREKSTKSLYTFGIKFPKMFFHLYYKSAQVNDPTILEWMSLVLYNILLNISKTASEEYKQDLIEISKFLTADILCENAKYETNHLITRNYSMNTLKLIVNKFSLPVNVEQIRKNFKKVGITRWQEAEDLNEGEYRDGNSLIDYHFNKDKMPYIMVGRGNEYNETPEFKSTKSKLRWRAYHLGYDFSLFGEIDKSIAKYQHYGGEFSKIKRYAEKYIETAFLEYCGYLQALNKLKSYEQEGYLRTFDLRYDPTEAESTLESKTIANRFVNENYIDTGVDLKTWCKDIAVPNIEPYLVIDKFLNKKGNFALLYGFLHQHNKKYERQLFFQIETVFVNNKSIRAARKAFTYKTKLGWASRSNPQTLRIHESEIPDADIIPYNEYVSWDYNDGFKTAERAYEKIQLIKNGKVLNDKKADEIWEKILKSNGYLSASGQTILKCH
ncbi:MAG: hypothetical protein WKF59_20545 [Chitinophagaceae bacterium]